MGKYVHTEWGAGNWGQGTEELRNWGQSLPFVSKASGAANSSKILAYAVFLSIVLQNTDICSRLFHRLLYNPLCAAACGRLN